MSMLNGQPWMMLRVRVCCVPYPMTSLFRKVIRPWKGLVGEQNTRWEPESLCCQVDRLGLHAINTFVHVACDAGDVQVSQGSMLHDK